MIIDSKDQFTSIGDDRRCSVKNAVTPHGRGIWNRSHKADRRRWSRRESPARKPALHLGVRDDRPRPLDADERRADGTAEIAERIFPAGSHGARQRIVCRIGARRWIQLGETDAQSARARKEGRQVRRIDLREIPQNVQQPAKRARNRHVHTLPHDRLRLRVCVDVALSLRISMNLIFAASSRRLTSSA